MCEFDRSRLIAWTDGELEPPDSAEVRDHLTACSGCRRYVAGIRQLSADIGEYTRALSSPRRPKWRWVPAAAAAAVLFAAALRLTDLPLPDPPAPITDPRVVQVAVPLEDLLPIGAAPPGAVIVGEVVLDIGGTPRSFRIQGSEEPQGD